MSYYGDRVTDENEHLIAVGNRQISDLTEGQQKFIAGMQRIYDCIEDEQLEYDDCDDRMLDQMASEISIDTLDDFKERIMSEMVEAVVSFADANASD